MVKAVVIVLLLVVLFGLFRALYFLVTNKGDKEALVRSLGLRVAASALILVFLLIAMAAGWIQPHGVNPNKRVVQPNQPEVLEERAAEKEKSDAPADRFSRRRIEDDPDLQ